MKKELNIDIRAEKTLKRFPLEVKAAFKALMDKLIEEGQLGPPFSKKLTKNLFEIRVSIKGTWRGLYAYINKNNIIILHFFHKKTQKTPKNEIKIAQKRLTYYS